MNKIIVPIKPELGHILDDSNAMYGLKHATESGFRLQGIWTCDQYRDGYTVPAGGCMRETPNTFTTEGLSFLLRTMFWTTSKAASLIWYLGIFQNNVTPAVGNVASTALGAAGTYGAVQATSDVDETVVEPYTTVTTATASCTNAASKAEYTMADSMTIYGAYLTNSSDMTSVAGTLMSGKKFSTARTVIADDVLSVSYVISLTTS
jgi:surface antigen